MTGIIRVFVNERPIEVPAGSDVLAAVHAFDPALAAQLAGGSAYATDGRGIEISGDVLLAPGAILRIVVPSRKRGGSGDAHA